MSLTLVIEDGTGNNPAANSYVSLAEADTYHFGNLYAEEWNEAGSQKAVALAMATRLIDADMKFRGWALKSAQALAWPRIRAINDEAYVGYVPGRLSAWFANYFDETAIPVRLKQATAQVALDLLRADRTVENSAKGIASMSVGQGAVSLTFSQKDRTQPLSEEAQRLLAPLGNTRYGGGTVRVRRV